MKRSHTIKSIRQFFLETFWKQISQLNMVMHVFGHAFESDNFLLWVSGNATLLVSFIFIQVIDYERENYFRLCSFSGFSVRFLHKCLSPLTIICQTDCACFIALFIYMYVGHTVWSCSGFGFQICVSRNFQFHRRVPRREYFLDIIYVHINLGC